MNAVLLIAHAPLANALRQGALHVFPDAAADIAALDVDPDAPPDQTLAAAEALIAQLGERPVLVLTDVFGATPCNVAQRLCEVDRVRLLAGVNLPMLIKLASARAGMPLVQAVAAAQEAGRKYINVASKLLAKEAS